MFESNRKLWLNGKRAAAVFTFDVDDEYVMRQTYGNSESYYLSQGGYDTRAGFWRVLSVLEKVGVQSTFCVVGRVAERHPEIISAMVDGDHEVAAHGYDHTPYYKLSKRKEKSDIEKTLAAIVSAGAKRPVGHRTPGWNPSSNTLRLLRDIGGFQWTSDYLNDDLPYEHKLTEKRSGIIELPVAAQLTDWVLFYEMGMTPNEIFHFWRDQFDSLYEEGKLFVLTCHPLLIGRPGLSTALVSIIQHVKSKDDIWIARAREVASHWLKRNLEPRTLSKTRA
jgi:peptidoglycan/xylan/chitin deacetylase (PgdA/CDA1 family)